MTDPAYPAKRPWNDSRDEHWPCVLSGHPRVTSAQVERPVQPDNPQIREFRIESGLSEAWQVRPDKGRTGWQLALLRCGLMPQVDIRCLHQVRVATETLMTWSQQPLITGCSASARVLKSTRLIGIHSRRYAPEVSGCDLVMCPRSVTIAFPAPVVRASHYRRDTHEAVATGQSISVLAGLQWMTRTFISSDAIPAPQSIPDRWAGDRDADCSHSPGGTTTRSAIPRHPGMRWHLDGRQREGGR